MQQYLLPTVEFFETYGMHCLFIFFYHTFHTFSTPDLNPVEHLWYGFNNRVRKLLALKERRCTECRSFENTSSKRMRQFFFSNNDYNNKV